MTGTALALTILSSLFCVGLYVAGWQGMVLHRFRKWYAVKVLGGSMISNGDDEPYYNFPSKHPRRSSWVEHLWKPTWGCLPCMGSVWGSAVFAALHSIHLVPWWALPIHVVAVVGLNTVARIIVEG